MKHKRDLQSRVNIDTEDEVQYRDMCVCVCVCVCVFIPTPGTPGPLVTYYFNSYYCVIYGFNLPLNAKQNPTTLHIPNVRSNLNTHLSDTPFTIRQPIWRPRLLEKVYKPICTLHRCSVLRSSNTESIRDRV